MSAKTVKKMHGVVLITPDILSAERDKLCYHLMFADEKKWAAYDCDDC